MGMNQQKCVGLANPNWYVHIIHINCKIFKNGSSATHKFTHLFVWDHPFSRYLEEVLGLSVRSCSTPMVSCYPHRASGWVPPIGTHPFCGSKINCPWSIRQQKKCFRNVIKVIGGKVSPLPIDDWCVRSRDCTQRSWWFTLKFCFKSVTR